MFQKVEYFPLFSTLVGLSLTGFSCFCSHNLTLLEHVIFYSKGKVFPKPVLITPLDPVHIVIAFMQRKNII